MFSRWRNLAAAGAFCFPLSLAHAAPQTDQLHCTRAAATTRTQETSECDWFRRDRDAWYQRYYDSTIDEAAPYDSSTTSTTTPQVIISDITPIQDVQLGDAIDFDLCDEMNAFNDDADDEDDADDDARFGSDGRFDTTRGALPLDIESELFDISTPYAPLPANEMRNTQ